MHISYKYRLLRNTTFLTMDHGTTKFAIDTRQTGMSGSSSGGDCADRRVVDVLRRR